MLPQDAVGSWPRFHRCVNSESGAVGRTEPVWSHIERRFDTSVTVVSVRAALVIDPSVGALSARRYAERRGWSVVGTQASLDAWLERPGEFDVIQIESVFRQWPYQDEQRCSEILGWLTEHDVTVVARDTGKVIAGPTLTPDWSRGSTA